MSRKSSKPHKQYDRSHRLLFSHSRTIEDLLRGFVHTPWVHELDFGTLTQLPENFVSGQLVGGFEERSSDVIWRIDWKPCETAVIRRPLYLVILIEFQSTCDEDMALRMQVYVGLLYQRILKQRPLHRGERLPPVLPLIIYNGDSAWRAPLDVADLVGPVPEGFEPFRPSMRYWLIDEKRWPRRQIENFENVVAAIFRVSQNQGPEDLGEIVRELRSWLKEAEQSALRRDLTSWLCKTVLPSMMPTVEIPQIRELDEFYTVMETNMPTWTEQWYQDGFQKGEKDGFRRGKADLVIRLIEQKFGPVGEGFRARIETADTDQLLVWVHRVLGAERLEDIFVAR